jgi:hypothetical protein
MEILKHNSISDISRCISEIELMYNKNETIKKSIKDFPRLKSTLQDLDSLVEMYPVKSVIIEHIHMLIVLAYEAIISGKSIDECYKGHMLHTVFYGSPGVGKSRTARYLAEIWKALGVLKFIPEPESYSTKEILSKINVSRELFLDLYEKFRTNTKTTFKQTSVSWELLKEELKELGDALVTKTSEKISCVKDDFVVLCGREDFVAEYAGQTSIKTSNFIKKNLGKCIIIEEAYLLYNGESDTYGMEAITVLNRCMDEYADSIIIIFTGYEELLQKTIFKAQPGLKRRCQWIFNLQGYSPKGLSMIFQKQLNSLGWKIHKDLKCEKFFESHMDSFSNFGGDTERLALHCKMKCSGDVFQELFGNISDNKLKESHHLNFEISEDVLYKAYEDYLKHKI